MIASITSLALVAALTGVPAHTSVKYQDPRPISAAATAATFTDATARTSPPPASRDSLKNGALIGAIAGGVTVGLLATVGCGMGGLMSAREPSCGGATVAGAAVGAGLGALIGVGIDAMFERSPDGRGTRKGVRVRIRF